MPAWVGTVGLTAEDDVRPLVGDRVRVGAPGPVAQAPSGDDHPHVIFFVDVPVLTFSGDSRHESIVGGLALGVPFTS